MGHISITRTCSKCGSEWAMVGMCQPKNHPHKKITDKLVDKSLFQDKRSACSKCGSLVYREAKEEKI